MVLLLKAVFCPSTIYDHGFLEKRSSRFKYRTVIVIAINLKLLEEIDEKLCITFSIDIMLLHV